MSHFAVYITLLIQSFHKTRSVFYFLLLLALGVLSGCASNLTQDSTQDSTQDLKPRLAFEQEDRVIFIGDSITHGGAYHKNIYLFYATRFPEVDFRYYNAGIAGDTAVGTFKRYQEDIAINKPNVATIMLGMNDVGRWQYDKQDLNEQEQQKMLLGRKAARERYLAHMEKLIVQLKQDGVEIGLIKPSIFDETAKLERATAYGVNTELGEYGQELELLAAKYDLVTFDFYKPMMDVNAQIQAQNPSDTVVGHDRVHPGPPGHLLMAYAFLSQQNLQGPVADISLDAKNNKVITDLHCPIIAKPQWQKNKITFNCDTKTLPFPVQQDQTSALSWVPFQQEFNRLNFKVAGLDKGNYQIKIDGQYIGEYSAAMLAKGIDLGANEKTPMYQQAVAVRDINNARAQASGKVRSIAFVRNSMVYKIPSYHTMDDAELAKALRAMAEKHKGKPWYEYNKKEVENYLAIYKDEQQYRDKVDRLFDKLQLENKPKIHKWELERI